MNLQDKIANFIINSDSSHSKQITAQRLSHILEDKFQDEYDQNSIYSQELFRTNIKKISQFIISVSFNHKLRFVKIDQIVPFVSILQHLVHTQSYGLPQESLTKIQEYVKLMIVMQNVEIMRNMFEDGRNSGVLANFYENIYKSAFKHRVFQLGKVYGLKIENNELPSYLLQCVIQQRQGNCEQYDTKVTAQWIILALIYFVIAIKGDIYKQKAVLAKIIAKYNALPMSHFHRQINGDELCHFYNQTVLRLINKLQEKLSQRLMDQIKIDVDTVNIYLVNPIHNENNTVLDNIVFSSSWQM